MTSAGLGDSAPVADLDAETFRRVLDVNVTGTFLSAKAAFPALARQGGTIVTVGSVAGLTATPGFASYGASKAAVIHLTRILALEGASQGIRANAVCPSWVWTPMVEQAMRRMMPGTTPEQARQRLARFSPSGTLVTTDAVARAALYLACEDSAFVNGHALVVDSGLSIRG
jgi:NAD(P)-dependent dehydrogenase (short-subunit alcohol dehydrogenase family)